MRYRTKENAINDAEYFEEAARDLETRARSFRAEARRIREKAGEKVAVPE